MVGQDPLYGEEVRQPLEALRRQCIKIGSMGWDIRGKMESPGLRDSGGMGRQLREELSLG